MRFVRKQCKECPFRPTSLPGWLGSYTPSDVFSATWNGEAFFCHSSINYERKNWQERAMQNGKLCTGNLLFADKIRAPERLIKYPEIRSARLKVMQYESEIECMDGRQFAAHHPHMDLFGPERKAR